MMNIKRFHPGIYIKDSLEVMEMTAREFSYRTGISERTLSSIINGNGSITFDVAYKLSQYFDNSIEFWTNLQNNYDLYLKENETKIELENDWELVKRIKDFLLKYKYILKTDDKNTIVYKARKLAGVNQLSLLKGKDSFVCLKEDKINNDNDCFIQNFWIALALNEARKKNGIAYNKKYLINHIDEIRNMTTKDYSVFYPRLNEILTECGISFVVLPYIEKSNILGATKWFSKENVMLAVSDKDGKADCFWTTLFHEISHVLMEHRRETLFNIEDTTDFEADLMATNLLIPDIMWNEFLERNNFTIESINAFSNRINILPSIVLFRLYRERIVPYGTYEKEFNVVYQIV